jgi:hypothetical protein
VQRPARILAVTLAAVLGVLAGVVGAVLLDREHGADPLALDVTLVNQSCTGKFLVVTAWGTSDYELGQGVAGHRDAHYLDVDDSCGTAWKPRGTHMYGYVAYLGPYDSAAAACSQRMTLRGAFVTRLDADEETGRQCLCVLSTDSMPHLTPGMVVNSQTGIYVRALQDLLGTMKLIPLDHHFTGSYDPVTVRAIKEVQETGFVLPANGEVDEETWGAVIRQGCRDITD